MSKVCPKCGREFMSSRTGRCPVCDEMIVEKESNSEAIIKKPSNIKGSPPTQTQQSKNKSNTREQTQKSLQGISDYQNKKMIVQTEKIDIREDLSVKIIGIILIVVGALGIFMAMLMFGDIGIACMVGALTALLSGIAFVQVANAIKKLKQRR